MRNDWLINRCPSSEIEAPPRVARIALAVPGFEVRRFRGGQEITAGRQILDAIPSALSLTLHTRTFRSARSRRTTARRIGFRCRHRSRRPDDARAGQAVAGRCRDRRWRIEHQAAAHQHGRRATFLSAAHEDRFGEVERAPADGGAGRRTILVTFRDGWWRDAHADDVPPRRESADGVLAAIVGRRRGARGFAGHRWNGADGRTGDRIAELVDDRPVITRPSAARSRCPRPPARRRGNGLASRLGYVARFRRVRPDTAGADAPQQKRPLTSVAVSKTPCSPLARTSAPRSGSFVALSMTAPRIEAAAGRGGTAGDCGTASPIAPASAKPTACAARIMIVGRYSDRRWQEVGPRFQGSWFRFRVCSRVAGFGSGFRFHGSRVRASGAANSA